MRKDENISDCQDEELQPLSDKPLDKEEQQVASSESSNNCCTGFCNWVLGIKEEGGVDRGHEKISSL